MSILPSTVFSQLPAVPPMHATGCVRCNERMRLVELLTREADGCWLTVTTLRFDEGGRLAHVTKDTVDRKVQPHAAFRKFIFERETAGFLDASWTTVWVTAEAVHDLLTELTM